MARLCIVDPALSADHDVRWRHRYSIFGIALSLALIGWGGVVTSIDAGLAVPDWPSSFGSYDPLHTGFNDSANPSSRWWRHLPILAEHGHRLLGALVGLWVLTLALWTWRADPRRWMRILGASALGLVILQGVLGGLRVLWVSLDLAVAHALGAQLFFSVIVAMTLFTSPPWVRGHVAPAAPEKARRLSLATALAIYGQILLGALLRHPGAGVHLGFTMVHVTGSLVVLGLILATCSCVRRDFPSNRLLNRAAWAMIGAVVAQMLLGLFALIVLVFESSLAERSATQVTLNSAHVVLGALLLGIAVCLMLLLMRRAAPDKSPSARLANLLHVGWPTSTP